MGSSILPAVGLGGYGNATGADTGFGLNPKFDAETFKKLSSFVPSGLVSGAKPLGQAGANPFLSPQDNPAKMGNPMVPDTSTATRTLAPVGAAPGSGSGPGGNPNVVGAVPSTFQQPQAGQQGGGTAPTNLFGHPTQLGQGSVGNLNPASIGQVNGNTNWEQMWQGLRQAYGGNKGLATQLTTILGNGAGWNPQVAQAMMNDIEPYFQEHMADILEAFGSSGNRFSSTSALAAGKFSADFTAHQEALFAQMYQWATDNYIRILTGTGGGQGNGGGGFWGTMNNVLGLTKAGAGALTAAGVGAGGGTTGAILAGLAAL